MDLCQYEFQFQNEFMRSLETEIGTLLAIPTNSESMMRLDIEDQKFILRKKNSCTFMLFSANKNSYVYLIIVRCEKKYERELRDILIRICDEIYNDYGENHINEIEDVFLKADNRLNKLKMIYSIQEELNV